MSPTSPVTGIGGVDWFIRLNDIATGQQEFPLFDDWFKVGLGELWPNSPGGGYYFDPAGPGSFDPSGPAYPIYDNIPGTGDGCRLHRDSGPVVQFWTSLGFDPSNNPAPGDFSENLATLASALSPEQMADNGTALAGAFDPSQLAADWAWLANAFDPLSWRSTGRPWEPPSIPHRW